MLKEIETIECFMGIASPVLCVRCSCALHFDFYIFLTNILCMCCVCALGMFVKPEFVLIFVFVSTLEI